MRTTKETIEILFEKLSLDGDSEPTGLLNHQLKYVSDLLEELISKIGEEK